MLVPSENDVATNPERRRDHYGLRNLTLGGLTDNWEALSVERLNVAEMDAVEARWESWLIACKKELPELDDPKALERAAANKVQRAKIKKALKFPGAEEEAEAEGIEEGVEEIIQELAQNQVLIAEVPKGSNRWNSVGFDLITYQQFFGVTLGKRKNVQFYHVQPDGSWEAAEQRQSVEVKSQNYRFEVGAAHGIPYPVKGHPLLIFQRITNSIFNYPLLMPGEKQHTLIQSYLDNNYANNKRIKRRIVITAGELQKVWPECPFFI